MERRSGILPIILVAVSASMVFVFDLFTELGVAAGVPYVVVILIALWFRGQRRILITSALCSALVLLGYFLSPSGGELWKVLINRGLALFAIWVTAVLGVQRNHSEAQHQQELREKNQRHLGEAEAELKQYYAIVESVPFAIVLVDREGTIILVNNETEKMFGYQREELIGQVVETLIPARYRSKHPEYLQNYFVDPEARMMGVGRDLRGLRKDGTEFSIEIGLSPTKISGEIVILSAIADITQRKRTEDALRASNEELEAFCYSVSHDLRAPLRHMDGFSQALIEDYGESLEEGAREMLQIVRESSQQMGSLIDSLLALSRLSRSVMECSTVDVSQMVRKISEDLSRSNPERKVTWIIAEGVQVLADRGLLQRAMYNLLENAWKYTSKRAEAVIEFGVGESDAENPSCFVRDNGAGFEVEYADKMFLPFQRLHTDREFEGSGIGLATVERVIFRHGGKVWADSEVGKSATFYFTLSRNPEDWRSQSLLAPSLPAD